MALPAVQLDRAKIPEPWIPLGEVAWKLGISPEHATRIAKDRWEPLRLARKFGNRWAVLPDADSRLGGTRFERRDFEQIADLCKAGVKPKYILRAEAQRDIATGFDDFEPTGRGAIADAEAYCAMVLRSDLAIQAGIRFLKKSSLYRWRKTYYAEGIAALARKSDSRGVKTTIGEMAWQRFLEAKAGKRKVRAAWEIVRALVESEHQGEPGWEWPAYRTVALEYQKVPHVAKVSMDEGPNKLRAALPKIARSWEDVPAGGILCGDQMTFDFMARVAGDKTWRRARLKLTAWMDLRSRMIAGWHIADYGNSDTILSAFKMAVGVMGTLPDEVLIDNGQDYKSVAGRSRRERKWDEFDPSRISTAFERLKVEAHYAIVRSPWSKPIESRFRTIHAGFDHWFPSYWGHKTDAKPWDADRWTRERIDLLPTAEEVRDAFARYLVELHERPVVGDGMFGLCPRQALAQFFTTHPRPVDPAVLELCCCRMIGPVSVTANGVRHEGIHYGKWDEPVIRLGGQSVYFLVDPVQADRITLCDADGVPLCIAFADRNLGQTRSEVRAAKNATRAAARIAKAYPQARDFSLLTTDQKIAELRARAAAMSQVPDESLPPPPAPESLRIARPDVADAAERIAGEARRAAGADALRRLHSHNAAAAAVNDRSLSLRDLPADAGEETEAPAAPRRLSLRDLPQAEEFDG